MLGKLIKYEFKSCARIFFPLYAAIIAIFFVNGLIFGAELRNAQNSVNFDNIFQIIGIILIIAIVVTFFITTYYVTAKRFAAGVFGDEGYLTNTLPVKKSSIILSKTITMFIFQILSAIAFILAFVAMMLPNFTIVSGFLSTVVMEPKPDLNYLNFGIALILSMIIEGFSGILIIYFCVSIAHLKSFVSHKYITGFATYIIIIIIRAIYGSAFGDLMGPILGINSMNNMNNMQSIHDVNTFLNGVTNSIYLSSAIEVIWVIATFIVINYILNNKLNLE